jgi:hypothetical protein
MVCPSNWSKINLFTPCPNLITLLFFDSFQGMLRNYLVFNMLLCKPLGHLEGFFG